MPLIDLKGLLPEQLRQLCTECGQPDYRSDQLFSWIHEKGQTDIMAMSNLPAAFRASLVSDSHVVGRLRRRLCEDSKTGMAAKFLFDIEGGGAVESVLIIDGQRRTACLSSQVGCPLNCQFCATGRMGLVRNLSTAEIVDQLMQLNEYAHSRGERVTNVVMMGMGEPLLNYDAVTQALRLITLPRVAGIGGRRITVSTAGYLPGIRRLADDDLNVGLAISLNATTNGTRDRLMPINRRWPIEDLLDAAQDYFNKKGRRVTFEYVLMEGVTDSDDDARRLAQVTRDVPGKINVIPYNKLAEEAALAGVPSFRRPPQAQIERFLRLLRSCTPKTVTLRESRGQDIDAACGQLFQHNVGARQRRPTAVNSAE
ncbi:MAG: 23S rRNA (adenine(2503)-C(2))-methyltransferase RlmN [Candidatus Latescibacterota bacterium]|nr:23S rRNA (adenine(2503)-C(2))-methyltransferase RlmN [Candidatus Latescibacterota bacterium]